MWILASAIFSFSSKLRNPSENVQLRTAIRWCHANVHSLNRRVPAAVERYESTSGSLSKVGIVLEASAHNQKQKENGTMKTIARMMTMVVFAVGFWESITLWLSTITMRKRLKRSGAEFRPLKKPRLKKNEATGLI